MIPIDEDIVTEITNKFNIHEDEIRYSILKNKLNDISTLCYLIVNKKDKEGKKSISDFKRDIFIIILIMKIIYLKNMGMILIK